MNAPQYTSEIVEEHLVPYWQSLKDLNDAQLMEDGHPAHTSKLNQKYKEEYGLRSLLWSASSPDLNLMKNAWHILKARLRKRWHNKEKRPQSADELWEVACEEWEAISQATFDNWVDSMPKRVNQCYKANGGHTKW